LDLVFTDCQPKGNLNLPSVAGLQFLGSPGRATSFSMINFQTSSSTTLSYSVQAAKSGRITIPSFEVVTDKGKISVPSLALDISQAATNQRRQGYPQSPNFPFPPNPFQNQQPNPGSQVVPPDAVQASAEAEPRRPYVGEVFDVNYRVVMTGNRSGRVKTTPLWDVQNFTAEAWDRGQQIGPGGSQGLQFHTRAMVPKAGLFELPSIRQKLDIDTASGGRSFFFTAPGSVEVEAVAAPVALNVEPLPGGAPTGFQGAVGQFVLESKMVPEQVNEGEPVTWTLTLRGTGNWPMGVELPGRVVPKEIRTIQPKLRREFNGTEIFTGAIVEDLVMIPTQSGEYVLPPVKFVYFDPKKKSYESAEAKPPKIVVTRQASGLSLSAPPSGATTASPAAGKKTGSAQAAKPAPPLRYGEGGLPREPLEGTGRGVAPVPSGVVIGITLLPWLALFALWWIWAKKRSIWTDEERGRKEALRNWKVAVATIRGAGADEREKEKALLAWQKAVAETLGIEGATPSWPMIYPGTQTMSESDRKDLEQCWIDSENGLYGRSPDLDGGWCDQAEQLALRIDLPKMKFWEPLRIRNIIPWGLGIILLAAQGATLSAQEKSAGNQAEDGIGAYRAGNFSVAEQGWREKLQKDPKDPVARNNLALTYFQMGDKERALAYGLSAYLISPGTSTVGWNTRIFAQAADQLDGSVLGLWDDRGSAWLTSRLGVFGWQALLVLGSVLCALGLGLGLAAGYFDSWRKLYLRIGAGVLLLGIITGLTSGSALGVYGKLVDRSAVMIVDVEPLRSIPTEVEPQAEKAYPPGSIAHLEKSFLGWSKIRLPNQDSGWIRTEHLVPLY
jgi:tetratricopeptide (TPR) repeat protein